jgi:hypothetical protein
MSTCPCTVKRCAKCGEVKDAGGFYKESRVADGLTARCKACMKSDATTSYQARQSEISERNKATYCPIRERDKKLRSTYGISLEVYEHTLAQQGYVCSICGRSDPQHNSGNFVVDHNHSTGNVRGLLCSPCNLMLGQARDDQAILANAINYLKKYA